MVFAGISPWTFFLTGLSAASNSLTNSANLISKVYFLANWITAGRRRIPGQRSVKEFKKNSISCGTRLYTACEACESAKGLRHGADRLRVRYGRVPLGWVRRAVVAGRTKASRGRPPHFRQRRGMAPSALSRQASDRERHPRLPETAVAWHGEPDHAQGLAQEPRSFCASGRRPNQARAA
jgi:hypothetical protein